MKTRVRQTMRNGKQKLVQVSPKPKARTKDFTARFNQPNGSVGVSGKDLFNRIERVENCPIYGSSKDPEVENPVPSDANACARSEVLVLDELMPVTAAGATSERSRWQAPAVLMTGWGGIRGSVVLIGPVDESSPCFNRKLQYPMGGYMFYPDILIGSDPQGEYNAEKMKEERKPKRF